MELKRFAVFHDIALDQVCNLKLLSLCLCNGIILYFTKNWLVNIKAM